MFVKNVNSIKRKTILVSDEEKMYLVRNGYFPVSRKDDKWVYVKDDKISILIEKTGGDDKIGR